MILWPNSELEEVSHPPKNAHNCIAMLDLLGAAGKDSFIKGLFMLQCCNITIAFIGNQTKTPNGPEQSAPGHCPADSVAVILPVTGQVSQTSFLSKRNVLQLNSFLISWVFSV